MTRRQLVQLVAVVVIACAVARWLPGEPGGRLGFGDARLPLRLGQALVQTSDVARAVATARGRFAPQGAREQLAWVDVARRLAERTPPDARIQLKGVGRNQGWILAYDLYPRRVVGDALEAGGGVDDATLAGVEAVVVGTTPPRLEWVTR